jgi:capsular exopolysaccharide synthesis family protein
VEQVYKQPRKLLNSINEKPNYETFRKIRYALTSTRGIGIKNKKLLITSSISGEGKSYISTNLAISYAEVGKKVVVLDLDFKNPALSNQMNLADEIGITDYLAGSYSEEEVIHELYDHSNIYFVPIGKILDHTTSLLENGAIHQFLSYLEDNFDLIIIDSSPMSYVADAYLLAEVCDTTLFIVKHGYSPKNRIQLFDLDYSTSSKDVVILYNGVRSNNYSSNSFSGYYSAKKQEGSFDDRIKLLN